VPEPAAELAVYAAELERRARLDTRYLEGLQPKQRQAAELLPQADEILYGGAAGGGKTWWLSATAIHQMERHPNNFGILFRRYFKSLEHTVKNLIDLMLGIDGPTPRAVWSAGKKQYIFPNGSKLLLSHMKDPNDWKAHQGISYGFIGFEEATEFTATQLEELRNRARSPVGTKIRPKIVLTTNPGGVSHDYIKGEYVRPAAGVHDPAGPAPAPMVVWRETPTTDRPDPPLRVYVPALLEDNAILMANDPTYASKLASISDRGRRKAMREGDWDALEDKPGALWTSQLIDATRVYDIRPADLPVRAISIDPAWSGKGDATGIIAGGRDNGENDPAGRRHAYIFADYSMLGRSHEWAPVAMIAGLHYGTSVIIGEATRDGKGDDVRAPLAAAGFKGRFFPVHARIGKYLRASPVANLFYPEPFTKLPARVHLVGDNLKELEGEMCDWEADDKDSPNRLDAMVHLVTWLLDIEPADLIGGNGTGSSIPGSSIVDQAFGAT